MCFQLGNTILTKSLDNIITGHQWIGNKDQKFKNNYNEDILENNKNYNKIVLNTIQLWDLRKDSICILCFTIILSFYV